MARRIRIHSILRNFPFRWLFAFILLLTGSRLALADTAAFDLSGPPVEMKVTRGGNALPISEVPNLQPGDRLWIHPDLPQDQSVRYLLIVAFLRGSTNPPPENWFIRAETWNRQVRSEGIVVTVPEDAQQALLFLAPETGGDFSTLRSAVRGKPGAFVRASQDLNQASLDRSRLEKYLTDLRQISEIDPKALHDRSVLLARTLSIRLDEQCFDRPTEEQESCLSQNKDQLVLDDGHSQSMVAALTSDPSTQLIGSVASTPLAGGGAFSPYVGAVVDLARLMGSFHTAEYQYIPALALPQGEHLNLKLNNPPSFHNPKSVIVVGLPAVEAAQLPPLRAVNSDEVFCIQKSPLVLPVQGAPLVFSTDIAHDFSLRVRNKSGAEVILPASPHAASGGFVIDTHAISAAKLDSAMDATLQGSWGFESFTALKFHLQSAHPAKWTIPPADRNALIVGREDTLHLQSDAATCVETVVAKDASAQNLKTTWKAVKPDEIEMQVPLKTESAGPVKLLVSQFGQAKPDELALRAFIEAAHLDRFTFNAGDQQGILAGTRLDEVQTFEMKGVHLVPAKLSRVGQTDELRLSAAEAIPVTALQPAEQLVAHVGLKDGRILDLQTTVEPARPKVTLMGKSIQRGPAPSAIRLANQDDLPQGGQISFFLKTEVPETFSRAEKIEVAAADGSFSTLLGVADGSLILQDSQNVLAVLDPLKDFGPSAFGQLRFRAVESSDSGDIKGDWQPLAKLVRIPSLKEVRCPDAPDKPCTLTGSSLYLLDSVASDQEFAHTVPVPIGFAGSALDVPRPNGTLLYVKLRDDPSTADMMVLPVLPEQQ